MKLVRNRGKPWKVKIVQAEPATQGETNKSNTDGILRQMMTSEFFDVDKLLETKEGEKIQELLNQNEFEEEET